MIRIATSRQNLVGEYGGRKPQAYRRAGAKEYHDDHDVVSAESVCQVSRCPATDSRSTVVDGDNLVCERGTQSARVDAVACQIRDWDEKAPFEEICGNSDNDERWLAENPQTRKREQCRVGIWFQTAADQKSRESEENEEDEALDSRGPGPVFLGEKSLQHEREDDTSHGASCASDARGVPTLRHEEVTYSCSGGRDDQRCPKTSKKAESKEEVPKFYSPKSARTPIPASTGTTQQLTHRYISP